MPRSPETRRRFLGRTALAAAGMTLAARRGFPAPAAPAMAPADAWPQFRGTPTLSGLSAATLSATLTVAASPALTKAFNPAAIAQDRLSFFR